MARTTCLIEFDGNQQKVFYGGQLLSGRATLTLHKEKTVRGISIKIDGRAYCRWTEGSGDSKKTHIGEESYLSERTYFLGDKIGEIVLQPGVYSYTFQCLLPAGLPTSVEADHGHIRYSATVNLDRPMWPDQEFEEGFTVLKPLNLNDMPHLRFPIQQEKRKTFSLICCLPCCAQSDPLFITASMPASGFTPGDTLHLSLFVKNNSYTNVASFRVRLEKHITFRTNANSSKHKVDIVTVCEGASVRGCAQQSTEQLQIQLQLPPVPPTDTTTSTICRVEYCMKIQGVIIGCHTDPELHMPVTIGTVPFIRQPIGFTFPPLPQAVPLAPYPQLADTRDDDGDDFTAKQPLCPVPAPPTFDALLPSAPSAPQPCDPMTLMHADCDPPTYEQAVSGQVDIQGKMFAPFYPVYRRPEQQQQQPEQQQTTTTTTTTFTTTDTAQQQHQFKPPR